MQKNNYDPESDLGIRFLIFRKAIKKERIHIAYELNIEPSDVDDIENGSITPEINYLHELNRKYGLNINWMLCGEGQMFTGDRPSDLDDNYVAKPPVKTGDPLYGKYTEFIQLMQIPVIEEAIMNWLEEFKDQMREQP
ncbi:MAG: hypothetical protein GY940_43385 [bacterium]|nr:hypothetical protein [bacterium]